jgi:acylphosphatase
MKRFTFIVSGNIQKAGYRDRVIELGKFVNLTGYAENLPDGRVRIIAEGEEDQLEFYREHINIKNTLINVENIEYMESEATGEFYGFLKLVSNDETDARLDTAANILKDVIVNMNRGFDKVNNSLNAGFSTLAKGQERMLEKQDKMMEKQDESLKMQRSMLDKQDESLKMQTSMLDKQDESLKMQTSMLDKQDESLKMQTSMLDKQDESLKMQTSMLDKQDESLKMQTSMLDKQDESLKILNNINNDTSEIKSTLKTTEMDIRDARFSLTHLIETKFKEHDADIAQIKTTLAKVQEAIKVT